MKLRKEINNRKGKLIGDKQDLLAFDMWNAAVTKQEHLLLNI